MTATFALGRQRRPTASVLSLVEETCPDLMGVLRISHLSHESYDASIDGDGFLPDVGCPCITDHPSQTSVPLQSALIMPVRLVTILSSKANTTWVSSQVRCRESSSRRHVQVPAQSTQTGVVRVLRKHQDVCMLSDARSMSLPCKSVIFSMSTLIMWLRSPYSPSLPASE